MRKIVWLALLAAIAHAADTSLSPLFQRVDLAPTAATQVLLILKATPGTRLTGAVTDCSCVRTELAMPAVVPASGDLTIPLRVTGVRPGVEEATIHTTVGSFTARIQIAGPGTGQGLPLLTAALAEAKVKGWAVWGIVHDQKGQIRACGCSRGAMGGAGHLAALPAQAAALAPDVTCRWVLTGDVDGSKPGLGAALAERGWSVGDPAVAVSADPGPLLMAPGIVAVIPAVPVAMEHRRLLRPVLDGGLVVELLLVDAQGVIQMRHVLPVDATLADDPAFVARFPDPLTKLITRDNPSQTCRDCHASAVDTWTNSRHAQALLRLPAADHTDTCIRCHTLPLTGQQVAGGVHCQSCHTGTEAHVAASGATKTTGAVDCRSCHDARHDPGFDQTKLWEIIRHGR